MSEAPQVPYVPVWWQWYLAALFLYESDFSQSHAAKLYYILHTVDLVSDLSIEVDRARVVAENSKDDIGM